MTNVDSENTDDNNLMITNSIDGLISFNLADKIATKEKIVKHQEKTHPELVSELRCLF